MHHHHQHHSLISFKSFVEEVSQSLSVEWIHRLLHRFDRSVCRVMTSLHTCILCLVLLTTTGFLLLLRTVVCLLYHILQSVTSRIDWKQLLVRLRFARFDVLLILFELRCNRTNLILQYIVRLWVQKHTRLGVCHEDNFVLARSR